MLDQDISTADARRLLSVGAHHTARSRTPRRDRTRRLDPTRLPAGRRHGARRRHARRHPRRVADPRRRADPRRSPALRSDRPTASSSRSCCTAATTVSTPSCRTPTATTTSQRANIAVPQNQVLDAERPVRPAPAAAVPALDVPARPDGGRARRRVPQPRPVALHVDGDLDERSVRLGPHRTPGGSAGGSTACRPNGPSWPPPRSTRRSRSTWSAPSVGPSASRPGVTCSASTTIRPTCACTTASRRWRTQARAAASGTTCSPSTMRTQLDLAHDVAPAFEQTLPEGNLSKKMTIAARLINARHRPARHRHGARRLRQPRRPEREPSRPVGRARHGDRHVLRHPRARVVRDRVTIMTHVGVRPHLVVERVGWHRSRHRRAAVRDGHARQGRPVRTGTRRSPASTSGTACPRTSTSVGHRLGARRLVGRRWQHHPQRQLREPRSVRRHAGYPWRRHPRGRAPTGDAERLRRDRPAACVRHP